MNTKTLIFTVSVTITVPEDATEDCFGDFAQIIPRDDSANVDSYETIAVETAEE